MNEAPHQHSGQSLVSSSLYLHAKPQSPSCWSLSNGLKSWIGTKLYHYISSPVSIPSSRSCIPDG